MGGRRGERRTHNKKSTEPQAKPKQKPEEEADDCDLAAIEGAEPEAEDGVEADWLDKGS